MSQFQQSSQLNPYTALKLGWTFKVISVWERQLGHLVDADFSQEGYDLGKMFFQESAIPAEAGAGIWMHHQKLKNYVLHYWREI